MDLDIQKDEDLTPENPSKISYELHGKQFPSNPQVKSKSLDKSTPKFDFAMSQQNLLKNCENNQLQELVAALHKFVQDDSDHNSNDVNGSIDDDLNEERKSIPKQSDKSKGSAVYPMKNTIQRYGRKELADQNPLQNKSVRIQLRSNSKFKYGQISIPQWIRKIQKASNIGSCQSSNPSFELSFKNSLMGRVKESRSEDNNNMRRSDMNNFSLYVFSSSSSQNQDQMAEDQVQNVHNEIHNQIVAVEQPQILERLDEEPQEVHDYLEDWEEQLCQVFDEPSICMKIQYRVHHGAQDNFSARKDKNFK